MKTAIILVTFNGYSMTRACLSSLARLSRGEWILAVADNASTDGTPERIREDFPDVFVFEMGRNAGFGFANNEAVRRLKNLAAFDTVCFLNNDTLNAAEALETLARDLELAQKSGEKVIFAPKILGVNGNQQFSFYRKYSLAEFFLNAFRSVEAATKILNGTPKKVDGTKFLECFYSSAVCWFMQLSAFEEIGGFDERIFMYYEDDDFGYRARKLGYKFYLDPSASLTHLGGGSSQNSLSRSLQCDSSQEYFFGKHFGKKGRVVSKAFRVVRSSVRVLVSIPSMPFSQKTRTYAAMHLKLLLNALKPSPSR